MAGYTKKHEGGLVHSRGHVNIMDQITFTSFSYIPSETMNNPGEIFLGGEISSSEVLTLSFREIHAIPMAKRLLSKNPIENIRRKQRVPFQSKCTLSDRPYEPAYKRAGVFNPSSERPHHRAPLIFISTTA
jgi:hypothetical protein